MVQKFTQRNFSRWVTQDTVNMRTVYGFKLHRLTWTWISSYLPNFDGNFEFLADVMWLGYVFLLGSRCGNSMTFKSVIWTFWFTYISERHPEFQSFFINLRNAMTKCNDNSTHDNCQTITLWLFRHQSVTGEFLYVVLVPVQPKKQEFTGKENCFFEQKTLQACLSVDYFLA